VRGIDAEALKLVEGKDAKVVVADGGDQGSGDVETSKGSGGRCATAAHVDADLGVQGEFAGLWET